MGTKIRVVVVVEFLTALTTPFPLVFYFSNAIATVLDRCHTSYTISFLSSSPLSLPTPQHLIEEVGRFLHLVQLQRASLGDGWELHVRETGDERVP